MNKKVVCSNCEIIMSRHEWKKNGKLKVKINKGADFAEGEAYEWEEVHKFCSEKCYSAGQISIHMMFGMDYDSAVDHLVKVHGHNKGD